MKSRPPERAISMGSLCSDAIFSDFHFIHAAEREQKLDEIFGRTLRSLADDRADRVGHGGVEYDRADLNPGEIDAYLLARLQHVTTVPRALW